MFILITTVKRKFIYPLPVKNSYNNGDSYQMSMVITFKIFYVSLMHYSYFLNDLIQIFLLTLT